MSRSSAAALLTAALLVLPGCGGTDDDATAAPAATPPAAGATAEPTAGAEQPTAPPAEAPAQEPEPAPDDAQVVEVTVTGDEISGDTGRVEVRLGTTVRLTVTSDTADELHVHGYDLTQDLPVGAASQLEFVADRAGVFEVELHDARRVLTRLQVS